MAEKGSIDPNQMGLILQAAGSIFTGVAEKKRSDAEAALLRRRAREIRAAGVRQAQEQTRQGKQVKGSAVAQQAAAGGAMDTAMIERMARIQGQVDYNSMSLLYSAESAADATRFQAAQRKKAGKMSLVSGVVGAVPSILDYSETYGKKLVPDAEEAAPIEYKTGKKRRLTL